MIGKGDRERERVLYLYTIEIKGFDLIIEVVYTMQWLCAYKVSFPCVLYHDLIYALQTVVISYSKSCELFTEEEWEGLDYAWVFQYLVVTHLTKSIYIGPIHVVWLCIPLSSCIGLRHWLDSRTCCPTDTYTDCCPQHIVTPLAPLPGSGIECHRSIVEWNYWWCIK